MEWLLLIPAALVIFLVVFLSVILIRGAAFKPKPQPAAEAGKVTWVCTICGYVYEGDPIPPDFICPTCKHPASDFERVVS